MFISTVAAKAGLAANKQAAAHHAHMRSESIGGELLLFRRRSKYIAQGNFFML
jgi:hypothetical protein